MLLILNLAEGIAIGFEVAGFMRFSLMNNISIRGTISSANLPEITIFFRLRPVSLLFFHLSAEYYSMLPIKQETPDPQTKSSTHGSIQLLGFQVVAKAVCAAAAAVFPATAFAEVNPSVQAYAGSAASESVRRGKRDQNDLEER